jgi:hypothetical protein
VGGSRPGFLLNALKQVNLTTDYQVLDRADAGGLAFRHRSFLEYFAFQSSFCCDGVLVSVPLDSETLSRWSGSVSKRAAQPRARKLVQRVNREVAKS